MRLVRPHGDHGADAIDGDDGPGCAVLEAANTGAEVALPAED